MFNNAQTPDKNTHVIDIEGSTNMNIEEEFKQSTSGNGGRQLTQENLMHSGAKGFAKIEPKNSRLDAQSADQAVNEELYNTGRLSDGAAQEEVDLADNVEMNILKPVANTPPPAKLSQASNNRNN